MLKAFLDDTGKLDTAVVGIAGFAAPVERWKEFEAPWRGVLSRFGLSWFHAVDCAHSNDEFEGWDEKRRRALSQALMDVISNVKPTLIGAAMLSSDFKALPPHIQTGMGEDPFFHCLQTCLHGARIEAKYADRPDERIATLVDDIPEFAGRAYKLWHSMRALPGNEYLFSFNVALVRETVPLQAADWLAYEMNLESKRLLGIDDASKRPRMRWPMERFLEMDDPPMIRFFSREDLIGAYKEVPLSNVPPAPKTERRAKKRPEIDS